MGDGGLRHAVDRFPWKSDEAGLRADADDAAVTLADHVPTGRLAAEKRPLQVHGERQVEILLPDVLGQILRPAADVVDENVQPPEMSNGFFDGVEDLAQLYDVHLKRQRSPPQSLDFADQSTAARLIAEAERNIGAGMREREGNRASDATGRSSDQGDLIRQIEAGHLGHGSFS